MEKCRILGKTVFCNDEVQALDGRLKISVLKVSYKPAEGYPWMGL
jgi:hypothetical protein